MASRSQQAAQAESPANSMEKGQAVVKSTGSRDCQAPEWKVRPKQPSLSKSARATDWVCWRKCGQREATLDTGPEDRSFMSEMEEMRRVFLKRPGCPQFCSRATSTSNCGSDSTAAWPAAAPLDSEDSKRPEDPPSSQQDPDMKVDGPLLPFSKSICEFNYFRKKSESPALSLVASSHIMGQRHLRRQIPWYLWVIHEKDHCLATLGEEVQRLSQLETQVQKKDEEILALQEEQAALKKQLRDVLQSRGPEAPVCQGTKEEEEEEKEEAELELMEEKEAPEDWEGIRRRTWSRDEDFEEELMAQLQEYEQVTQELQFELEVARIRHSLATGACVSLQRQVDHQESQLQRVNTENELLQKELRERKHQLQAMTDKFSRLREEKKGDELVGLMEKDNFLLQQQVWELERELLKREQALTEANAKASQLEAQVNQSQGHLQRWQHLREALQSKTEAAQHAEQQARVALESTQSRLERLRNKIIQATFGTSGIKSLATEISDSDILEALQRLVLERADYFNQLRQRGVKTAAAPQSEFSPNKTKKVASK
ncbi:coiled-coil domain-containing protein 27 [Pteronotus mesoamericanus]|uniref:coiled-coil domain-containing protein 27 n=1 Tax=Pteronotus mesoamericanus TaxID=1884717 RepID=UPI0023EC3732|nr:coiled-coil domain-containing protein 27 [Pteronotus parnellii mesoamericanus]